MSLELRPEFVKGFNLRDKLFHTPICRDNLISDRIW